MKIKMAKLLVPILLLSLYFMGGCSRPKATTGNKALENSNSSIKNNTVVIPCLVYQEQGDKIVALIANWKIDSGMLDIGKDQAFSFNKNDNGTRLPVTWDGSNNFILTDSCVPSDQYRSSTKLIPLFGTGKPVIFLGENIMLTKVNKPSGELDKYSVETEVNGEKISRDIRLDMKYQDKSGKSYDLNPNDLSFTYSDGKYAYFIFAGPVTSEIGLTSVKYNLVTDETSLSRIATDKQLDIGVPFGQYSVENIGEKFYTPTSDGIGMFDVYQNKFEYLKSLSDDCKNYIGAQLQFPPEDHPMYFNVMGLYNDILIVSVPTDTYNEDLFCAVKGNKIIGAIYIQGQTMKLMDANKNVKSEINLKELKLSSCPLSFPSKNGANLW